MMTEDDGGWRLMMTMMTELWWRWWRSYDNDDDYDDGWREWWMTDDRWRMITVNISVTVNIPIHSICNRWGVNIKAETWQRHIAVISVWRRFPQDNLAGDMSKTVKSLKTRNIILYSVKIWYGVLLMFQKLKILNNIKIWCRALLQSLLYQIRRCLQWLMPLLTMENHRHQ